MPLWGWSCIINKRKEEELQEHPYFLWVDPTRKKDKKREEKGSKPTHTKEYLSFLFLSNWKLRKYFVGEYDVELETLIIMKVTYLIFILKIFVILKEEGG